MKFFAAALSALALAPVTFAQDVTLEEKWRILDEPTFSFNDLTFTLGFTVSEFIIPGQSEAVLYTEGCKEDGTALTPADGINLVGTNGIKTDVVGTRVDYTNWCAANTCPVPDTDTSFYARTAGLEFTIVPSVISNSQIYTEDTAIGDVTAQVRFCVRYGLTTGFGAPGTNVEVNFLETLVTLDIDLSDGFTVDSIAVAPRDRLVRTAAQAYLCEGYFCGTDELELSAADLAAVRNQGAELRVCVRPDADARADGVYMRRIDSFTWTRDAIQQQAVVNALEAANSLTTLDCSAGDLICHFESILFAQFYATAGAVTGNGVCSMQFGGDGCEINPETGAIENCFEGENPPEDENPPEGELFAYEGEFRPEEPLGVCEGDCNEDFDCAEGLYCYQRDEGDETPVPGCIGTPFGAIDYCVFQPTRKLQGAEDDRAYRYLQEEAATAEFDLSLELNQGNGALFDGASGAASATSMAMCVLAMVGAVLMM